MLVKNTLWSWRPAGTFLQQGFGTHLDGMDKYACLQLQGF